MKKKITLKEWTRIGKLNHAAKWCRHLCSYYLVKLDDYTFLRVQNINILMYCLIFIPVHILQALVCLWDGGLKEFRILDRFIGQDYLIKDSTSFECAEQIWNNCNKTKN